MKAAADKVQDEIQVKKLMTEREQARSDRNKKKYGLTAEVQKQRSAMSKDAQAAAGMADELVNFDLSKPSAKGLESFMGMAGITQEQFNKMSTVDQGKFREEAGRREYYEKISGARMDIGRLSVEEQKKLVTQGGFAGELAASNIASRQRFDSAVRASGGSELGATAKLLGADLSKEQLKFIEGGKDAGEKVQRLLEKTGMAGDKALEADLIKAFNEKTKGGKAAGIAAAVENPEVQKKLKEQREKDDPSLSRLDKIADALKPLAKLESGFGQVVSAVNGIKTTNAEGSPPGPGASGT